MDTENTTETVLQYYALGVVCARARLYARNAYTPHLQDLVERRPLSAFNKIMARLKKGSDAQYKDEQLAKALSVINSMKLSDERMSGEQLLHFNIGLLKKGAI